MTNTNASDDNKSQDDNRKLQTVWRSINKQQHSIKNLTQPLEIIQEQLQALLSINGQGHRNDDEEHGRGIGPATPTFNLIPNIRNQMRLVVGFNDTSYEEADFS